MRFVLGVALVCFVSTLVYCAGTEEGATKPTPTEVIDAIKKLEGRVTVDKGTVVDLWLFSSRVTDAGLVHLKGMAGLKRLYLQYTKVTDADIAELQKALPDCKISK